MAMKNHPEGDGIIDSVDLAAILRERQKANNGSYPRAWTHRRPRSWAEAVKSILKRGPQSNIKRN